ncbi:hypothetical protein SBA4_1120006 [Candidatus Sulfopaludibacter sp. SbA4]|nr:hypothetical protein SBA4_1120006 [Candidatus Sulfopaludibacter sp. SbA4]
MQMTLTQRKGDNKSLFTETLRQASQRLVGHAVSPANFLSGAGFHRAQTFLPPETLPPWIGFRSSRRLFSSSVVRPGP